MTMPPYEGLLTAMVTPFQPDGRISEDSAVALGRHLLAHGSDGLVMAGTTGEAATLTDAEQVALVALMVDELGDEGTIVAGAGSNDTRHAIELTESVVAAGAEAVLSVTPYYNKPNRRGIIRHFEEVARAAGGVPVILYNIPSRTAVNMGPELLAGNDEILAATLDIGGAGGICVSSHIVGEKMRRMFDVPDERAEIDAVLQDVYETLFITSSPTPVKAALNLLGHDVGGLRLPMVEADEHELEQVKTMLARQGLLEGAATA